MCGRSVKNMERKIKDKEKQERQFKSKKKKICINNTGKT